SAHKLEGRGRPGPRGEPWKGVGGRLLARGGVALHPSRLTRRLGRFALAVLGSSVLALPGPTSGVAAGVVMHPTVSDYVQVGTSIIPPTQLQCATATPVKRRCFAPQ